MKCLKTTLQHLVVEPGREEQPTWELRRMFDAILSPVTGGGDPVLGRLSALKEFDLNIEEWEGIDRSNIIEAIGRCAECCGGSLEIWRGTIPFDVQIDAEELGQLFGLFERLKVIHVPGHIIPNDTYKDEGAYVRSLASRCRVLEEICFTSTPKFGVLKMATWKVSRVSGQGWICSVRNLVVE